MRTLLSFGVFAVISVLFLNVTNVIANTIYSTDFDSLGTGFTENPARADQDGWQAAFHPGASFGEIQSTIANAGNAIHQYTDISNTDAQQSIDARPLGGGSLELATLISLTVDFYAETSDLDARNSYQAFASADGNHQGFGASVIGFGIGSGNGAVKRDVGVSIALSQFNGTDNNIPLRTSVGTGLGWSTWHSITLVANLASNEWQSITVNGATESLAGYPLPRAFSNSGPVRPTTIDALTLQAINQENFGEESSDSIYWDNVGVNLEYVPEPAGAILSAIAITILVVRRRMPCN